MTETLESISRRYEKPFEPDMEAFCLGMRALNCKIVVLDDDPTGIQTVHHVSVYTDWSAESIRAGFAQPRTMFFILTNSRSMSEEETARVHAEIAQRLAAISHECGKPFLLISRGDSTLRGHYPLETQTLRENLEAAGLGPFDGEVLCPFFPEGGRYTAGGIHYVQSDGFLIPAGETEFARDATFGYHNSDLSKWVEEKTRGRYPADEQIVLPLELLRSGDVASAAKLLMRAEHFRKIIVNALDYADLRVFALALSDAMRHGKHFLFRTAAALPKVLGCIRDQPLLEPGKLCDLKTRTGGLVLVGSHVNKTTEQMERLLELPGTVAVPFHSETVLSAARFQAERARVQAEIERQLSLRKTAVVYTSRKLLLPPGGDPQAALSLSVQISKAMTGFVSELTLRPRFMIAKGGITSSEIGVHGLNVRCAEVQGQVLPGIPVWKTGPESRFPGLSYIIFPGNVGRRDSLYEIVKMLQDYSKE